MRCARCGETRLGAVYRVEDDTAEVCRWCLDVDELNEIRTAEAREDPDHAH